MKEAIQKAIEGGYGSEKLREHLDWLKANGLEHSPSPEFVNTLLLDPLFWQALGKVLGWYEWRCYCGTYYQGERKRKGLPQGVRPRACSNCGRDARMIKPSWQANWHRFIDSLASGESAEEFFKKLLNEK